MELPILYLVAIKIPPPFEEQIRVLQNSLRPAPWRITMDPHITLLAPGLPQLAPDEAAQQFRILRLTVPAFTVTSGRVTVFERRRRSTVVLEVHPKPTLMSLISNLVSLNTWQDTAAATKRSLIPHITLVNQVSTPELAVVTKSIEIATNPPVRFECVAVSLFAKESRWPLWQELAQLSLAKE